MISNNSWEEGWPGMNPAHHCYPYILAWIWHLFGGEVNVEGCWTGEDAHPMILRSE